MVLKPIIKSTNSVNQMIQCLNTVIGESQLNLTSLYIRHLQRINGSILNDGYYSKHTEFQFLPSRRGTKITVAVEISHLNNALYLGMGKKIVFSFLFCYFIKYYYICLTGWGQM